MVVRRIDVGARGDQPPGNLQVIAVRRPEQCRDAVRPCPVDVHPLVEEGEDRGPILIRRRRYETQVRRLGRHRRDAGRAGQADGDEQPKRREHHRWHAVHYNGSLARI